MSKHLHKSASYGVRGLMAVLCLAFSVQMASAVDINSNLAYSANNATLAATDYVVTGSGAAFENNLGSGSLKIGSVTVPAGLAITFKSNVQYACFYVKLHGNGIVNFQQTNKANSREGLLLADEEFEGTFNWTAAKSLAYIGGANTAGAQGMPKGKLVFKVTGSLFSGYSTDPTMGGLNSNTIVKVGEIQCEDAYSGSSLNSGGFQLGGVINTYWEIGALNTDSYFSGSIKNGQLKGGYTGNTGLRKVGTGSLTLGAGGTSSNYSLGTEILEGGIYVNAAKAGLGTGAVNVAEGAFLGGKGVISNQVTSNGGILRPGAAEHAAGLLQITGAVNWGGGYIDIDLIDNDNYDTLKIVSPSLNMPGNTVRVYVDKDFTSGDEFAPFVFVEESGAALPLPKFTGVEVIGVGDAVTKIPVFDVDYLNQTGKLKITGFSMFSKTPRKLAGICAGTPASLEVASLLDGVSFTWFKDDAQVATGETYSATAAGNYVVTASKLGASEDFAFEVREGANPSTIAQGTAYRTDADSIFVTPKAGETIEAWQWYMAPVDDKTAEAALDFEWNPKYIMTTSGYYAADIYSELGCMTHLESTLVRFEPAITEQPAGNTEEICEGGYWKMNIAASTQAADGIIKYQWHYLGENATAEPSESTAIAGETATSYVARQSGYYVVYLEDARGYTYSDKVYVDITAIDLAGMPTGDVSECASDYKLLAGAVSATSGAPLTATYKWFKDGSQISGAVGDSCVVTANGAYAVEATVGNCVKTSKAYNVVLTSAGSITKDLTAAPIKVCADENVTLEIEASAAAGNLTYQWYNNGVAVRNATAASFSPAESGEYSVVISVDGQCETYSTAKEVTFLKVPTIRTQPVAPEYVSGYAGSLCDGKIGELNVYAVDVTSYQWYKDGQKVAGADKADFETTESGVYYVMLANDDLCQTKSDEVTLTAKVTPTSSISFNYPAVCEGMLFELIPEYADVVDKYEWYKDDQLINEATVSSYSTRNNGVYYVAATNECGTAKSNEITINTFANPSVLVNLQYSTLTASVTDPNPATVKYQWTLDEQPIAGATSNTYMVKKNGNYAVIVSNQNGCQTLSTTKLIASGITAANADIALQAVAAYPNPSTGIFKVQGLPTDAEILIQVDNLAGSTVFSSKFNGQSEASIDLTAAPAGMYFVKIVYGENTITKKVTIER